MNQNLKEEIMKGDFPEHFKNWIDINNPKLRYQSIEGAVRGYIRSLLPDDNISDWFSFKEESFNLQGFNIQIRKTGNKFPAFYSLDTIANFELSASYDGECYKVYAIPIAIGRF